MIGEKIKELRQASGISAEQIADFLKVSPATVYRYENGDISKMPAKFIKPLADYLSSTPAILMGWDDQEAPAEAHDPVLNEEETYLVDTYRHLNPRGKSLLLERAEELSVLQGEKGGQSLSAKISS